MKIKGKKAISLIVLVITILVLSILAATVIISLSNTNIISQANDAVKKTEAQQIEEAKSIMYADGILGNAPEAIVIGDTTLTWDEESKTIIEKSVSNGVTTVDKVTIPAGFYYVGGTKDTGLVISDNSADENKGVSYTCEGNQFVWVPVEYTATGVTDANGLDTGFTAVFKRGSAVKNSDGIYKMTGEVDERRAENDFTEFYEPVSFGVTGWLEEEYYDMLESVENYNGFYIARFEAGDGDVTVARTNETVAHTVVSKKGAYVYNYVSWYKNYGDDIISEMPTSVGAVRLSRDMYKNSASVVSTLCYGIQWDAALNFVSDINHDISLGNKLWGNYGKLLTCGAADTYKAKNIYDLSGNAGEWTMEFSVVWDPDYLAGDSNPVFRGAYGPSSRYDGYYGASFREESFDYVGFRVALYLK